MKWLKALNGTYFPTDRVTAVYKEQIADNGLWMVKCDVETKFAYIVVTGIEQERDAALAVEHLMQRIDPEGKYLPTPQGTVPVIKPKGVRK